MTISVSANEYQGIRDTDGSAVVGGGPAGLTVANRLSEDRSVTVLLFEAGLADNNEPAVEIPAFIGNDIGGIYDWNLTTVPQIYLDGAQRSIPQGRALGGGTILNGMLWNRGGQGDYQDWVDLGNPGKSSSMRAISSSVSETGECYS
jgi:choline dehydrogenase-like flavoprotein